MKQIVVAGLALLTLTAGLAVPAEAHGKKHDRGWSSRGASHRSSWRNTRYDRYDRGRGRYVNSGNDCDSRGRSGWSNSRSNRDRWDRDRNRWDRARWDRDRRDRWDDDRWDRDRSRWRRASQTHRHTANCGCNHNQRSRTVRYARW